MIFWKRMDFYAIWHKWSTGQGHETIMFGVGSKVNVMWHNGRFLGLAETSFSTPLDYVAFLILLYFLFVYLLFYVILQCSFWFN